MNKTAMIGGVVGVSILLQGCVYLDPMVDLVGATASTKVDGKDLPELRAAVDEISARIAEVQKKRDNSISTGRWLDIITSGLGVGSAGASLNSGHTNAIRNTTFAALFIVIPKR